MRNLFVPHPTVASYRDVLIPLWYVLFFMSVTKRKPWLYLVLFSWNQSLNLFSYILVCAPHCSIKFLRQFSGLRISFFEILVSVYADLSIASFQLHFLGINSRYSWMNIAHLFTLIPSNVNFSPLAPHHNFHKTLDK